MILFHEHKKEFYTYILLKQDFVEMYFGPQILHFKENQSAYIN